MIDDDVQAMLRERATDVHPSPDALDRIEARLDEGGRRRPGARLPMLAAAAVVVVVGLVGAVLLAQRGDDDAHVTSTPSTSMATTSTTLIAPAAIPDGVFPWPGDDAGGAASDPASVARSYILDRVGLGPGTTFSSFQQGDASSGEVVVGGDLHTTVLLRRSADRWFVQGAVSDALPIHAAADGTFLCTIETAGDLVTWRRQPGEEAIQASSGRVLPGGDPTRLAPLGAGRVSAEALLLSGPDGGSFSEVRLGPTPGDPDVPSNAISPTGRNDAIDAARAYLEERLPGTTIDIGAYTGDDAAGEVTWQAGLVRVERYRGRWFVVEAIGDSIQIAGTSLDVGSIGGALTLAQAGTVHLRVGDVAWDVRNDVDREGTSVHFEHDVPTDEPVILRAVFTTDTGYVSLAEKVVG
jgi:hypothetical protein